MRGLNIMKARHLNFEFELALASVDPEGGQLES